jgi:hypothetical protein
MDTHAKESGIRKLAARHGYAVKKSRQGIHLNNRGGYMLVDGDRNMVVSGERFDLSLDEIEAFLCSSVED